MPPTPRRFLGALLDRFVGWLSKLPPESSNYTIESLIIPLENGVKIAADLYRPLGVEPLGTILVRSPYGIGTALATANARPFAARRYQVLFSCCRGTAASTGVFDGSRCEEADGRAIVAWMRKQPWYTGSFATLGPSYMGFVQWALLSDPPPDMVAAIINTGPHDFGRFAWETGAFTSDTFLWADFQMRARQGGGVSPLLYQYLHGPKVVKMCNAVPLQPALEKHFATDPQPWLYEMMGLPDLTNPFWKCIQHEDAFAKLNIPVYLTSGWYDILMPQVMDQYRSLAANKANVALTLGPWTHFGAGGRNTMAETVGWLDKYVGRRTESDGRVAPVRIYITGKEEWRNLQSWPPPTTPYKLLLGPGQTLSQDAPDADTPAAEFEFDPTSPTPTIGVPLLFDVMKHNEITSLLSRQDVLVFSTKPLEGDLEVCGQPQVQLHHTSSHPHVDLIAILCEVDSRGKSFLISERFLRLPTDRTPGALHMLLNDCGHMFRKGHKIQLVIGGGSHPRFLRNFGTGEDYRTATRFQIARHSIGLSASAMSELVLPLVTQED